MRIRRTRPLLAVPLAFLALWTFVAPARAAAPSEMTYQGRLKEGGLPVTGTRGVEIAVCSDPIAAPGCIFTGSQNVAVANGLFKTTFTTSGWDPTAGPWYLEVRVNAVALTPREPLTSTPYALYASSAATLVASTGTAGVSISTNLFIVNGSRVGIGTTNPVDNATIEVKGMLVANSPTGSESPGNTWGAMSISHGVGGSYANNGVVSIYATDATTGRHVLHLTAGGALDAILVDHASTGDAIRIHDGVATTFVVRGDGNVGIGTSNPLARLHVSSGAAIFEGDVSISTGSAGGGSHLRSFQPTPPGAVAPDPACGTVPTAIITNGTDMAGVVRLTTGGGTPTVSCAVTVTFVRPYASTPKAVLITPMGSSTHLLNASINPFPTVGGFVIQANVAPAGGTIYEWSYIVIE